MADRYWVGGTASWDGTAGTKWALTPGGPGGETVPTTADDVFFTSASTGTVTIATGNTGAKSINCTGFTGTLTGTANISVEGSVTLVAGMTYTYTGVVTIRGTGTITTAGKSFSSLTVSAAGGTVTLGDALNTGGRIVTIAAGTFTTDNFSVTCSAFQGNGTSARTVNLGSSVVTASATAAITFSIVDDLTFNAGTSEINITDASATLNADSITFNNVSFTSTVAGTRTLTGSSTFNNLTLTAPSASGLAQLAISGNPVVTGTLTCTGATALRRTFVRSGIIGTTQTITAAAISAADCDFRDITLAGAAAGAAPTRAGDCGGNSGITFPAAKTVYRIGLNTTWHGSSSWSLTSGGPGSNDNFPLAQDTAVINDDGVLSNITLNIAVCNIGSLNCSSRTTAITLNHGLNALWCGSYTLGSGVTVSGTGSQTFCGRNAIIDITTAGKTITFPSLIDAPGQTFRLADSFVSSNNINLSKGTFNANNFNFTCTSFTSSSTTARTVTMGSGLWTLTGTGTVWNTSIVSGLTLNKNTANILLSNNTTATRTFSSGGMAFNKLTIGGTTSTSTTFLSGFGSFTELASTKTVAHTVGFAATQNIIDTWSITGTPGNVVTVNSNNVGFRRNFTLTNVSTGIDYLSFTDIGELSDNKFYVGANSTDGGNNDNVYFSAPLFNVGNMFAMFASA